MNQIELPGLVICQTLHKSATSTVYRGKTSSEGAECVIKTACFEQATPQNIARIRHEFSIGERLQTSAAVRYLRLEELSCGVALVREYVPGRSLNAAYPQPMPADRFLSVTLRLTNALAELHEQGIIHKDFVPENIIVDPETERVVIIDFNISSPLLREPLPTSQPSVVHGTIAYMSPEQTGRMNRSVDHRTDLYALGVIFYQLLTGWLPFPQTDPLELMHAHLAHKPLPLQQRVADIPAPLSAIALRLLAKLPEERYQSARGVAHDLKRCAAQLHDCDGADVDWQTVVIGEADHTPWFEVPQKLYGRQQEINTLLSIYQGIESHGQPEMVLITGDSGMGKSYLVRELHKPLIENRGILLEANADAYAQVSPYATIAGACRLLVNRLLTERETELMWWREELVNTLGSDAALLIELIPELALVIGEIPTRPDLRPVEVTGRFQQAFQRLLNLFSASDQPLVLFIDDVHWADASTLAVLQYLVSDIGTAALLVILAYRDDLVGHTHALSDIIGDIEQIRAVHRVHLGPLSLSAVADMVADTLGQSGPEVDELAAMVFRKTEGNPFFVGEFLSTLHRDGLITLEPASHVYAWDMAEVQRARVTDNMVGIMTERVMRLPTDTLEALRIAACIGGEFALSTLALVIDRDDTASVLWPAVVAELLVAPGAAVPEQYRWVHERLREVVLSLNSDAERAAIHLRIGRAIRQSGNDSDSDQICTIASHYNAGSALIDTPEAKLELAQMNLRAGLLAKQRGAHAAARTFFTACLAQLPADPWTAQYRLTYELYGALAECDRLVGKPETAELRLQSMLEHARTAMAKAEVCGKLVALFTSRAQFAEAVAIGLDGLQQLGCDLPRSPAGWRQAAQDEKSVVRYLFDGSATVAFFAATPTNHDPYHYACAELLNRLTPAAYHCDLALFTLVSLLQNKIALTQGSTSSSIVGYMHYAVTLAIDGDYEAAWEIGVNGCRMAEDVLCREHKARVFFVMGWFLALWTNHLSCSIDYLQRGLQAGIEHGDYENASRCMYGLSLYMLVSGQSLPVIRDRVVEFARADYLVRDASAQWIMQVISQAILVLQGKTEPGGGEQDGVPVAEAPSDFPVLTGQWHSWRCVIQLGIAFVLRDFDRAWTLLQQLECSERGVRPTYLAVEQCFYRALLLCTYHKSRGREETIGAAGVLKRVAADCWQLEDWAARCPANVAHKHALVCAEIARLSGDDEEASRYYERAIRSAREHSFLHCEAMSHEAAAHFYFSRRRPGVALGYLKDACTAYLRWGATAKVAQLERMYSMDMREQLFSGIMSTVTVFPHQIDVMALIKASQQISTEIVLDRLLGGLMDTLIVHAGAQLGYLILVRDDELWIEASATVEAQTALICPIRLAEINAIPHTVIEYVQRTKKHVLLADQVDHLFAHDPHLMRERPRSLLCMPLLRQGELSGVLYLENKLTSNAFSPHHITMLEILSTQAVISIENACLYRDLEKRVGERTQELEQTQQKLVDAARQAGKAEIATNVLHNVGNVLNSVNVSVGLVEETLRRSKILSLQKLADLLSEKETELPRFLTEDSRGKQVPAFFINLAAMLQEENQYVLNEVRALREHVTHIRKIVTAQQENAKETCVTEVVQLDAVIYAAVSLTTVANNRDRIALVYEFDELPPVIVDRHKILQILVNLINNARDAVLAAGHPDKRIILSLRQSAVNRIAIAVQDNGVGVAKAMLTKIFEHGFSTKSTGHGFGLHYCALMAQEMGGSLRCQSGGPGQGATFILDMPCEYRIAAMRHATMF